MTPNSTMPDRWPSSQWLMPLVNLVLGGTILVARAMEDDLTGGLIWFAIFAAVAGLVLIVALPGCVLFELARGHDPSPYTQLLAGGGATYAVTLLILRRR